MIEKCVGEGEIKVYDMMAGLREASSTVNS
jgi:hypothetical protein